MRALIRQHFKANSKINFLLKEPWTKIRSLKVYSKTKTKKNRSGQSQKPTENTVSQSKLEVVTGSWRKARENECKRVAIVLWLDKKFARVLNHSRKAQQVQNQLLCKIQMKIALIRLLSQFQTVVKP